MNATRRITTRCFGNVRFKSDVPAPRWFPVVGSTLSLLAAGGAPKLHLYVHRRHAELGPIFRDKIGSLNAVFVADPEMYRAVFAQEGKHPAHFLPEAWNVYNQMSGKSRGLLFMDGEEWLHYRRILNQLLLKGDPTWIESACESSAKKLAENFPQKASSNLEAELYRWSLDTIVALLITPENVKASNQKYENILGRYNSTVQDIFVTSSKLTLIPAHLAARFKIPAWKRFQESVDNSLTLASDLVRQFVEDHPQSGLLAKMSRESIVEDFLTKIVTDLVLAAGDTTAYTMQWILYLLARNKQMQRDLRTKLAQNDAPVRLKNIIRETLRLYPVAPFLTRILPKSAKIGDYELPPDTLTILSLYTSGRDPKYFDEPNLFLPDRWLRGTGTTTKMQLSTIPFAMGSRSCIGRKIAEIQLQTAISELVTNYEIALETNEEIEMVLKMVAAPAKTIKLKVTKL